MTGLEAPRRTAVAAASSSASGAGRRMRRSRSSKKLSGIVVGFGLHVLAEGQRHGPAIGRIGQHGQRTLQRRHDLFGADDAVEIARHGPEAIVGRDRAVTPILQLLKHGIGTPAGEHVPGDEQHRQPVHMGDAGRGHHIGGAGSDRRRAGHHAAAPAGLGEGDGRIGHALFVMRPERRQAVLCTMQGLAHARDVAMTEDRPDAGEERHARSVDFDHLPAEIAHQRLRGGQAKRAHGFSRVCLWSRSVSGAQPGPALDESAEAFRHAVHHLGVRRSALRARRAPVRRRSSGPPRSL